MLTKPQKPPHHNHHPPHRYTRTLQSTLKIKPQSFTFTHAHQRCIPSLLMDPLRTSYSLAGHKMGPGPYAALTECTDPIVPQPHRLTQSSHSSYCTHLHGSTSIHPAHTHPQTRARTGACKLGTSSSSLHTIISFSEMLCHKLLRHTPPSEAAAEAVHHTREAKQVYGPTKNLRSMAHSHKDHIINAIRNTLTEYRSHSPTAHTALTQSSHYH